MDVSKRTKFYGILQESFDFTRLVFEISERYLIRQEAVPTFSFTLFDTFDWRLFKIKRTLILSQQNLRMLDLNLSHPYAETAWRKKQPPKFWWDLPEGELQKQLQTELDIRALLPWMAVSKQTRMLRVLNQDEKTVVFLFTCLYKTKSKTNTTNTKYLIALQPVRGYPTEFEQLQKFLSARGIKFVKKSLCTFLLREMGLEPGAYSSKFSLKLEPELSSAQAFHEIVSYLFTAMKQNERGIQQNIDTEFLHDYRVAIRRIRSALGQLKTVIPKQQRLQMQAFFSKLGKATNQLRDLDVYMLKKSEYFALLPESLASGLDPLFQDLSQEREREYQAVVQWLNSAEYAKIIHACETHIDRMGKSHQSEAPQASRPILELANANISKRYQRILKAGRKITDFSQDVDLHRLRINCKKLRYLLEFFASLYPKEEVSRLIGQLKKLQNNLGDYNDLRVQQRHLQTYLNGLVQKGKGTPDTAGAIGGLITSLHSQQKKVRQDFKERFRAFSNPQNQTMFKKLFKDSSLPGESE